MNKYKVGDKFIIEIAEVYENVLNDIDVFDAATSEPLYRIKGFNSLVFDKNGLDKLEKSKNSLPIPYSEAFKKEIKVGDVVTVGSGDITFICTKDNSNGDYTKCHLVAGDGSVYEDCDKFECQKTGKSIDIGEILKEIDT